MSLYFQSLNTFVNNLNQNVVTLDRINCLRLLPTNVLADIYVKVTINMGKCSIESEKILCVKCQNGERKKFLFLKCFL